jgi:uncharacterized protein YjbJ (UPF0337 family)
MPSAPALRSTLSRKGPLSTLQRELRRLALCFHTAIEYGGFKVNADQMKGNWKQIVGKAKEKWGKLTDNDWQIVEGKRDQLVGRIQERYGIARKEAERQVADFERSHESF